MIPKVFFTIPYPSRFSGYLGYQKSGINIALFGQQSSIWEVTCNLDFTCILPKQNMATWQRVLVPWLDNSGSHVISLYYTQRNQFAEYKQEVKKKNIINQ